MRFRVEAPDGKVLADGHDLAAVRRSLRPKLQERLTEQAQVIEQSGLTEWPAVDSQGNLPQVVALPGTGQAVRAYPTLVDEGDAVGVRVVESREAQAVSMHAGTLRLLLLQVPSPAKAVLRQLSSPQQLILAGAPMPAAPRR